MATTTGFGVGVAIVPDRGVTASAAGVFVLTHAVRRSAQAMSDVTTLTRRT